MSDDQDMAARQMPQELPSQKLSSMYEDNLSQHWSSLSQDQFPVNLDTKFMFAGSASVMLCR